MVHQIAADPIERQFRLDPYRLEIVGGTDPRTHQDGRRTDGSAAQCDATARNDLPNAALKHFDANSARAIENNAIDQTVWKDRQIGPCPRGHEVADRG